MWVGEGVGPGVIAVMLSSYRRKVPVPRVLLWREPVRIKVRFDLVQDLTAVLYWCPFLHRSKRYSRILAHSTQEYRLVY